MPNQLEINGAAINGALTGGNLDLSAALAYTNTLHTQWGHAYTTDYEMQDVTVNKVGFVLNVLGALHFTNTSNVLQQLEFSTSFNLTGDTTVNGDIILEFIASLVIAGESITALNALVAIAETIANSDFSSSAFGANFLTALDLDPALDIDYHLAFNALSELLLTDTPTMTARILVAPTESLVLIDDLDTNAVFGALFEEGLVMGGLLNTPEGVFEAWVVNAETKAPFQYDNFPFNSFAQVSGRYLAMSDTGLYELTGSDDAGTSINAIIKTGLTNFGSNLKKSIPRAYFGYTSDGDLLFKTITTSTGKKVEDWYRLEARTVDDTRDTRVKIGRGLLSTYWQFEIVNVDGADFDIDDIKLLPAVLKRRI